MSITIDLAPDACAMLEFAIRRAWAEAEYDVETARSCESPERQKDEDSETFQAGRRAATAKNLAEVLKVATCASVTLPDGAA